MSIEIKELENQANQANLQTANSQQCKKPTFIIEPKKVSFAYLLELWSYRELCYFFVWRDLKVRYRQTLLGASWAILQPLITMLILSYVLGKLAKMPSNNVPYPIFFYSGLVLWTFFSNSVTNASTSLTMERNLITKVYFPRMLLSISKVITNLVDLALTSILLVILAIIFKVPISWKLLLIPPVIVCLIVFTNSMGMLLAALNVIYRDVRYALPFVIQVLFFVTPIMFPLSLVPAEQRWLIALNPLAAIIELFRLSLFNIYLDIKLLIYCIGATTITFIISSYIFIKLEKVFAEKIQL